MSYQYIIPIFIGVNIFSLILVGVDKLKAIRQSYRISEKALFLSALPFSSYGFYLGMKLFHHKTKKRYFKLGSYFLMILHTLLILYSLKSQLSFA
ncbi:DUF1294 domain-containing protein [Acidaminobacter sp. JC074]|uniref:DUF1294 domain-containing protein n=1 Tax=Acidaminobacter sp. JC074 TaxID=2530199 RepID=UPI001F114A78|nr:DUF1294 domain-containing protein [Acidaminobacter sp. JC074]MCH4887753.1 DUF1294 domain-containing protein [Acidaminobacter sp. JC074]